MTEKVNTKIVIVGSGFGGLCIAIKLKKAGIHDFVVLEKEKSLGGTWRDNTYPGAECDIPSALYSYSFEHNSDWEFKWSGQAQILQYQQQTSQKYGLGQHIKYCQAVISAKYSQEGAYWLTETSAGQIYQSQYFISAVGQLNIPSTPYFNGAETFQGAQFHSSRWNHGVDLSEKRVAVIGNAASAVQFIPEVAKTAKYLCVYQRSANWVLPKLDRAYTKWEQKISDKVPLITKFYRFMIWAMGEYGVFGAIKGNRFLQWSYTRMGLRYLKEKIKDPSMRKVLTPTYQIGAKRILFSDHYYDALARSNVELKHQALDHINEAGIVESDQKKVEFDVIIYATGFQTNPFLAEIDVEGKSGNKLHNHWSKGAFAYKGIMTHGFPNLFMLFGPNTNLGHTSIIIMLEAQADFIVEKIQSLQCKDKVSCEVKKQVEDVYNEQLQAQLSKLAFSKVDNSWYMDNHRITNNWAGGTREYQRLLKQVNWADYHLV